MESLRSKPGHLYAIDLLRFLAAIGVVACHWGVSHPIMRVEAAKYGVFGVQLFFLISGFVILMSAQNQSFREFVVARLVRLYPAFWICCTISALVAFNDPLLGWPEYLANMTMLPNPFYVQLINPAYWSLLVELKFYLLISALILTGALHRVELVFWAWLLAAALSTSFLMGKLILVAYAPFFAGGCACFLLRQEKHWHRWALLGVSWLLAMRETAAEVLLKRGGLDTQTSCLLVTVFFLAILAVAMNKLVLPPWPGIATLGAISYPIYLLHERIAIEIGWTTDNPLLFAMAFVWIAVLSYVVHRWGEIPLQKWMRARLERVGA